MNKWLGTGRLVKDPEVSTSRGDMSICKFTLAVDRRYQKDKEKEADFIRCTAFGKTADHVGNYYHKGDGITVEGEIRTGSYDKDGIKHYTTEVIVSQVEFPMGKNQKKGDAYEGFVQTEPVIEQVGGQDEFDDEESLPF